MHACMHTIKEQDALIELWRKEVLTLPLQRMHQPSCFPSANPRACQAGFAYPAAAARAPRRACARPAPAAQSCPPLHTCHATQPRLLPCMDALRTSRASPQETRDRTLKLQAQQEATVARTCTDSSMSILQSNGIHWSRPRGIWWCGQGAHPHCRNASICSQLRRFRAGGQRLGVLKSRAQT